MRARTYIYTYIAQGGVLPHLPVHTYLALQSVIYDLVAAAFITGHTTSDMQDMMWGEPDLAA